MALMSKFYHKNIISWVIGKSPNNLTHESSIYKQPVLHVSVAASQFGNMLIQDIETNETKRAHQHLLPSTSNRSSDQKQMEQQLRQSDKNDDGIILLRSFISKETILSYDTAETSTRLQQTKCKIRHS
jgi:hypothetical protein